MTRQEIQKKILKYLAQQSEGIDLEQLIGGAGLERHYSKALGEVRSLKYLGQLMASPKQQSTPGPAFEDIYITEAGRNRIASWAD